jgi:hypothetical protein
LKPVGSTIERQSMPSPMSMCPVFSVIRTSSASGGTRFESCWKIAFI